MKLNYEVREISFDEVEFLSKEILSKIREENISIDTLVPVLRGGMVLSMILQKNMEQVDTSCIHIKRSESNEVNASFGSPNFYGITNEHAITGKRILIVEDIIDSGKSLDFVIQKIKEYHPAKIYVATLYNFNQDKYQTVFSGKKEKPLWIVFPWEHAYE
ncbi:MAG: hypothetical protein KH135_01210 [Firmicutes bacterium]|nr:hypothetical protein [Bacillota bacterium]